MFKYLGSFRSRRDWYFTLRARRFNGTYRTLLSLDFSVVPGLGERCLFVSFLGRSHAFWTPAELA